MRQNFGGWEAVTRELENIATTSAGSGWLNDGQRASLRHIAHRLPTNGVLIADEVGMGKTRIAAAVARAVIQSGGRVAVLVPPGLTYQWKAEFADAGMEDVPTLRSLWQYTRVWGTADGTRPREWFEHNALVVSHAFANWRLGERSEAWRWALLAEIYAQWHLSREGKLPYGYRTRKGFSEPALEAAARSIVQTAEASYDGLPRRLLGQLFDTTPWPEALEAGAYRSAAVLRPKLECAVGLGLGTFDLVIVDEAHKSRGDESILSNLLHNVIIQSSAARRLALTATPVELGVADWKSTLNRIGVQPDFIGACIDAYALAVKAVRETPSDKSTRDAYKAAATAFQEALAPYLIRRDKSEDRHVRRFETYSREPRHAYRRESDIAVDTASLSLAWRRAVCAAEALSLVTRRAEDPDAKRLRLTFGNGHGIAAMLRQARFDEPGDTVDIPAQADKHVADDPAAATPSKRRQRAVWWSSVLNAAFAGDGNPLYDHPAILAAVMEVEKVCEAGEKALVFGRYTAPLRALTELLNARAMLRSLRDRAPWPQTTLSDSEWAAVQAAHRQQAYEEQLSREALVAVLAEQYKVIEQRRRIFRAQMLDQIEAGLTTHENHQLARKLFVAFRRTVEDAQGDEEASPLALVARTLQELLTSADLPHEPSAVAAAFVEFVDAAVDRGENDDGNTEIGDDDAMALWRRITSELNSPQGGFARLMNGDTQPRTRRLLQVAFNRENSAPRVLVAQSMVGREGLNLHKACKTVVLLHPEWNPGVVEQQIGRVDRIGGLWQKALDKAIDAGVVPEELPRIMVRPVVFKGTYDEWNWTVLRERWDDLRAQLQGVVISPRMAQQAAIAPEIVDEINRAAPRFAASTNGISDQLYIAL